MKAFTWDSIFSQKANCRHCKFLSALNASTQHSRSTRMGCYISDSVAAFWLPVFQFGSKTQNYVKKYERVTHSRVTTFKSAYSYMLTAASAFYAHGAQRWNKPILPILRASSNQESKDQRHSGQNRTFL